MAFYLLQPDGVPISAGAHRRGRAALYGGGAGRPVGGRSGFRVDTASDILKVSTTSWSLDPCSGMIDPGASTNQGMYGWAVDHTPTGTPTPPDSTLPRKDIYYLQVNDSSAGDGTSGTPSINIYYLAGTPAANPVAPALPARSFLVGTATVPQNGGGSPTVVLNPARFAAAGAPLPVYSQAERDALVKSDGLIVQRRDLVGDQLETWDGTRWAGGVGHAEFTASIAVPASSLWGPGQFALDTGASKNAWFSAPGAADFLTVTADGFYTIGLQMSTNGAAVGASMSMRDSTGNTVWSSTTIPNGATDQALPARSIYLTAGTTFRFRFYHTASTAQTWTSRAWVTRLA